MALTIKGIEAAKPKTNSKTGKQSPVKLSDGNGLMLFVTSQNKIWRARYFYMGKEQNLTLGKFPLMSLKAARDANFELRQQLDRGENPAQQKKERQEEQRAEFTEQRRIVQKEGHPDSLGAIAEDWLTDVQKKWKKKTFVAEAKRVRKHLIQPLGYLLVKDIKAQEHIRPLFQGLEDAGKYTTLKKVAEKTVSIFNFAIALGKCENNPAYAIWKGLSFTKPSKNNSLPSITDSEKIGQLLIDIDAYAHNATANSKSRRSIEVCFAAKILPYVFLRPSHLVESKWNEINWKAKQWCIPGSRMKNGKDFIVPLSVQVISLLKELHGYTGSEEYIFHSQISTSGHITIEAVNKVFSRMGYKGEMCGHGWRHAFVTNCKEELKYNSDIIFKQMSHTIEKDAAKATYDKAEFLPERTTMMQGYADYLDNLKIIAAEPVAPARPEKREREFLTVRGCTQEKNAA